MDEMAGLKGRKTGVSYVYRKVPIDGSVRKDSRLRCLSVPFERYQYASSHIDPEAALAAAHERIGGKFPAFLRSFVYEFVELVAFIICDG